MYARGIVAAVASTLVLAQSPTYDLSKYLSFDQWRMIDPGYQGDGVLGLMSANQTRGLAWTPVKLLPGFYEMSVVLQVTSEANLMTPESKFDGIGLWIVDSPNFQEHSQQSLRHKAESLLNYNTDFVGFGTFLAMSNRQVEIKPSASVLFGAGAPRSMKEVPTEFGIYWNFVQSERFEIRFTVDDNDIIVQGREADGVWKEISHVRGLKPVSGYLGISALAERAGGEIGANVTVLDVSLTTGDQEYANLFAESYEPTDAVVGPSEEVKKADMKPEPRPESKSDTKREEKNEVHEALLRMIQDLKAQQDRMNRSIQVLASSLKNDNGPEIEKANLKEDIISKSDVHLGQSHDSLKSLQANAASLESTVRKATTYSTYFACGISASFLGFAALIYKRMKDMEKRHFL